MRRTTTATAVATASILSLMLVGCSTGTETPAASSEAEAPEASEAPAPVDPTDPACLIGDWLITEAQMQSFYDALSSEIDGLSIAIAGDTGLSFTSDTYVYTPDFVLTLEVSGIEGEGDTSGSLSGSWTASEGVLTTEVGENSLATQITVLGVTQDGSELLGSFITSDPINSAPFDCSDPAAPVLQFETSTGRTPIVLTARG